MRLHEGFILCQNLLNMETSKKHFLIGLAIGVGMGTILCFLFLRLSSPPASQSTPPGASALNLENNADPLLKVRKGLKSVYRFPDKETGIWQVAVGKEVVNSDQAIFLGLIFENPNPPEVTTPVYLCSFKTPFKAGESSSVSLDSNSSCSGEGKLLEPNPVGYTSKLIRNGFLLAVRCKSSKLGMYNSTSPGCEGATDRPQAILGAIRAPLEIKTLAE